MEGTHNSIPGSLTASYVLTPLKYNNNNDNNVVRRSSSFIATEDIPRLMVVTKAEYSSVLKTKRSDFVHSHFEKELAILFKRLAEDAEKMKQCHRECSFEIPDHFNKDRMEALLKAYFIDLGYTPITENSSHSSDKNIITITIT
jgi:hypothetical protein